MCVCVCVVHVVMLFSCACMYIHRANDQSGMTRLKNVKSTLSDKKKEEDALDDVMERCKQLLGLLTEDDVHQRYPQPQRAVVLSPCVMCC